MKPGETCEAVGQPQEEGDFRLDILGKHICFVLRQLPRTLLRCSRAVVISVKSVLKLLGDSFLLLTQILEVLVLVRCGTRTNTLPLPLLLPLALLPKKRIPAHVFSSSPQCKLHLRLLLEGHLSLLPPLSTSSPPHSQYVYILLKKPQARGSPPSRLPRLLLRVSLPPTFLPVVPSIEHGHQA